MKKYLGLILAVVFLLTGCSDEEIKSKTFYMENETALSERLEYCEANPDRKITDSNCINALDAKAQIRINKMGAVGVTVDYSKSNSTVEKMKISEKTNTKAFYLENKSALTAKLKYCNAHPEKKYVEPNCIKALAAEAQLMKKRL